MSSNPLVICWGELLWDLFPEGERLGGCAANVAYHVARLGGHAKLVSRVGHDSRGDRALAQLAAGGVDVSLIQRDPVSPTGTVGVALEAGEPRFSIAAEAAWDRLAWTPEVAREVERAGVLYYGTLAQRTPLGSAALGEALRALAPGVLRVCDLNVRRPFVGRDVVERVLTTADVLKLNEAELALLGELMSTEDPLRVVLDESRVKLLALTLGARGCRLVTAGERVSAPAVSVTPEPGADSVGAGDAFTAVLCRLVPSGLELGAIAARACRYAGFVAARPGAMPPIPDELVASVMSSADARPP